MRVLGTSILLISSALAQGHTVVPASADGVEGPGLVGVAGVGFSEVQQFVIDAAHLQAMVGRTITGLRLRRDASVGEPLAGGTAQLTIRLGAAPHPSHPAQAASPVFTQNIVSPVQVFSGPVTVPASNAPSTPAPWSGSSAVQVTFTTPYVYSGGPLCLEVSGSVSGTPWWWPVDGVGDPASGAVTAVGTACGPWALQTGRVASVAAADLVPGGTALFTYRGTIGAPVFLALGADTFAQPLDLGIVGAPGCDFWLDPMVVVPTAVVAPLADASLGGFANVRLHLPSDATLLGAPFAAQWLEITTSLVSSEALLCRISTSLPTLGIATVYAEPGATEPIVQLTSAPVLRFDWQ